MLRDLILKSKQSEINRILCEEGGVLKRIDEHREIVEFLTDQCPELIVRRWWIKGWLISQDMFLCALLDLASNCSAWAHRVARAFPLERLCGNLEEAELLTKTNPDWHHGAMAIPQRAWLKGEFRVVNVDSGGSRWDI